MKTVAHRFLQAAGLVCLGLAAHGFLVAITGTALLNVEVPPVTAGVLTVIGLVLLQVAMMVAPDDHVSV